MTSEKSSEWYAKKPAVVLMLFLFFPIGLLLMWKFTEWTQKTKWIVTSVIALLVTMGLIGVYNSPPTITVSNLKNGKIETDDSEYVLQGTASSMKSAELTINGQPVSLDGHEFSHKVSLKEGGNTYNLVAINENGETSMTITVHRTTKAEFAARAGAERLTAEEKRREPLYAYQEFYDWATEVLDFEVGDLSSPKYRTYSMYRWKYINSECDRNSMYEDGDSVTIWDKSCLQDKYGEFIKASAFDYGSTEVSGSICPQSDAEYYGWVCTKFGDMLTHIQASQQHTEEEAKKEENGKAEVIYNEIALTGNN